MYTKLAFGETFLNNDEEMPTVELPQVVPASKESGRPEKTFFHELEVPFNVCIWSFTTRPNPNPNITRIFAIIAQS